MISTAHTILSLVTEIAHAYKNRQTDYIMEKRDSAEA